MRENQRAFQYFTVGLVAMILTVGAESLAAEPRQFSQFPAKETVTGKISAPNSENAPKQWSAVRKIEKDIIREEIAKGPNFGGAYYLATVGCGTGCEAIFVIDLRNGRIYRYPEAASNGVAFQKDSRLIIVRENTTINEPRVYLVFENGEFRTVE